MIRVCLLLQDLHIKAVRGEGGEEGDVLWMRRAAACVDESDHVLMYLRHWQTVREEGVDE